MTLFVWLCTCGGEVWRKSEIVWKLLFWRFYLRRIIIYWYDLPIIAVTIKCSKSRTFKFCVSFFFVFFYRQVINACGHCHDNYADQCLSISDQKPHPNECVPLDVSSDSSQYFENVSDTYRSLSSYLRGVAMIELVCVCVVHCT